MLSFPRPTTTIGLAPPIPSASASPPRTLLRVLYPSTPTHLPALPSPARAPTFTPTWTRSTHLVPAVLPRTTADVPCIPPPPRSSDAAAWKADVECTTSAVLEARRQHAAHPPDENARSRKLLWHALNRYVNRAAEGSGTRLTLLLAHPNGLPKETWEPALLSLIKSLEHEQSVLVEEVWAWEAVNHGDSALLNAPHLGGIYDWADNARDILNFLTYYLPDTPASDLPLHLSPVPPTTASARTSVGFSSRTLVGVGHSLGGVSTAWAALHAPALFAGLVLLDPVIESRGAPAIGTLLGSAVKRRTHWPSPAAAHAALAANPFFGAWAPAVLAGYIEHGMCPAQDGGVRLKMGGMLEAVVFADYWSGDDVFRRMPGLDARVALRWIMPGVGRSWFGADSEGKYAQRRVWLRPENSSNVIVPGAGHLLAQEAPDEIGRSIAEFLVHQYGETRARL